MFLIYVANTINVKVLAEQWGTVHNQIPNGTAQAIQSSLKLHDWRAQIGDSQVLRNPRIVQLTDANIDDIPAIGLTAMMHDPMFQILGYVTEEDAANASAIQTQAQLDVFEEMFDKIKANMMEGIKTVGVNNRVSWNGHQKVTFNLQNKLVGSDARQLMDKRSDLVQQALEAQCDLSSIVTLVKG